MWTLLTLLVACDVGTLTIEDPSNEPADTDAPAADTDAPSDTPPPAGDDTDAEDSPVEPPAPLGDLSETGPHPVAATQGDFTTNGCELAYTRYQPRDGALGDLTVILTHGFMRDRGHVARWARHLASWGVDVVTPDLCHAAIWDADHEQNGLDLASLANDHLAGRRVIYMGHSAGGLASLLASTHDVDALGVLGLDLVDTDDAGLRAAAGAHGQVMGLIGAPSWSCNLNNNGLAALTRAPGAAVYRVTDTTHCDFENPTDGGCTALCGFQYPAPAFNDAQQRAAIAELMTAHALWVGGLDDRAAAWWTPGQPQHDDLVAAGLLSAP